MKLKIFGWISGGILAIVGSVVLWMNRRKIINWIKFQMNNFKTSNTGQTFLEKVESITPAITDTRTIKNVNTPDLKSATRISDLIKLPKTKTPKVKVPKIKVPKVKF